MLENPANRNIERCGKCIPLLIQIVDNFENPTDKELELCVLIIVTLGQCIYHDNLTQQQLKCNIIEVLLRKMEWTIGTSSKIGQSHIKKKSRNERISKYLEWQYSQFEPLYGKRRKCICEEVIDLVNFSRNFFNVCNKIDQRT